LITIDARIVVASVDTYLRFAEATNRLQLGEGQDQPTGLAQSLPGQRPGARGVEDTTGGVIDRTSEAYDEEPLDHRRERREAVPPSRPRRPAPRERDA
jgi:gas vesicle structural protein